MESWKRAINPAFRVLGYSAALSVILAIVLLVPAATFGIHESSPDVYSFLGTLWFWLTAIGGIIALFKVIDEERLKAGMELGQGSIKLM